MADWRRLREALLSVFIVFTCISLDIMMVSEGSIGIDAGVMKKWTVVARWGDPNHSTGLGVLGTGFWLSSS